jgi:hypothetical protein
MVSSADIRIALYETTNSNERLVAFSSSKIAYYTKCGVPIIAFDTESFRLLMNSFVCGELINTVSEIPLKVHQILDSYDLYRDQAQAAYKDYYNLDKNFSKFLINFEQTLRVLESFGSEGTSVPVNAGEKDGM